MRTYLNMKDWIQPESCKGKFTLGRGVAKGLLKLNSENGNTFPNRKF